MQARVAGYALTNLTNPKQLVGGTVVGLTAAKFEPLILPIHGFSLSSTTYNWISIA
jgi:Na+-transporting NADH:ubiquinone oxidoreductase subunit NqrC